MSPSDHADVAIKPPLLFLGALGLGCLLSLVLPIGPKLASANGLALAAGLSLAAAGFALYSVTQIFVAPLDFFPANTINSLVAPEHDYLWSFGDVVSWAERVGVAQPRALQVSHDPDATARALRQAQRLREAIYRSFSAVAAGGIVFALLFQIFINVGMTIGVAPVTGIPLPMVSVGGSAMVGNLLAIGVLQAIHARGRSRRGGLLNL